MEKITMFVLERCPYCKKALAYMDQLIEENPKYKGLEIDKIDELKYPEISDRYDYSLVPAYYFGYEKIHEGVTGSEDVRRVFDEALSERA